MNQLGWHWWPSDTAIATHRLRGPRALHQSRPLHAGLRAGRQGQHRHHLLAARASAPASSCARAAGCARSPPTSTAWPPASIYYDADGVEQFQPAEVVILACNGVGTPRLLLNSASARFPERPRQLQRPGRQEPDVPPLAADLRLCRRAARRRSRPADCACGARSSTRPTRRAASCAATRFQFGRGIGPVIEAITSTGAGRLPWGADHHRAYRKLLEPPHRAGRRSARTCPRSTTASRSIPC